MSNEYAEIPSAQGNPESLGPVDHVNRRLYFAVIILLGSSLLLGICGWIALTLTDRGMPEGLVAILGSVAGALVALISSKP